MTFVPRVSDELTTRLALLASASAFVAGLATLAYLLSNAGPLVLCDLWPPPRCVSGYGSGRQFFTGDSQAAPVWHVTLAVISPLLAVCAAYLLQRRRFVSGVVLAALACVPYSTFLFGAYAVVPFHLLVVGAVVVTFIAVSVGTTRAVWAPKPDATSA
jgi:hypothetical protein